MARLNIVDFQVEFKNSYVSIDIDQNQSFAFSLKLTDITNPTATKIPYSVQISLPKTQKNSDLFDHIWKFDSRINKFNPIDRTNFRLYINNDLYQSGYIKLDEVTIKDFRVTLFGGLGDYFYTLADDEEMKLRDLDFSNQFTHVINKNFVSNCWNGEDYTNTSGQRMNDYFCYAMTYQGEYDNFDNSKVAGGSDYDDVTWQRDNLEYTTYGDMTEHDRTYILDRQYYGEYRSYYQKPMVKFSTIFNKIVDKMKTKGWNTILDETFFNNNNPYWSDLWMICPQYDISSDSAPNEINLLNIGDPLTKTIAGNSVITEDEADIDSFSIKPGDFSSIYINIPIRFNIAPDYGPNSGIWQRGQLAVSVYLILTQDGIDYRHQLKCDYGGSYSLFLYYDGTAGTTDKVKRYDENYYKKPGSTYDPAGEGCNYNFSDYIKIPEFNPAGGNITASIRVGMGGDTRLRTKHGTNVLTPTFAEMGVGGELRLGTVEGIRSNTEIGYGQIIRSNVTCYDFLMSYCKIFGMYFVKDKYTNTVSILTRNSFYGNLERLDWTDKLDYSKEVTITPLGWDYRTGIFKWKDLDTKYEEDYLNRTGREYGSMRYNTNYGFNRNEHDYLEGIIFNNCIIASDYSKYFRGRVASGLYNDNKTLPHFQNNDKSKVDTDFVLVFRNGYDTLDKPFAITDDEVIMTDLGYCWNKSEDTTISCSKYPKIVRYLPSSLGGDSLNFGRPSQAYNDEEAGATNDNPENGDETIYSKFWKGYIYDRYNQNTKLLTAYFVLNLLDIQQNLFNKFIYINDTLWLINEIHQFDPTNKQPTRVQLVSVQSPSSYISQKYVAGRMVISREGVILYDSDGTPNTNPVIIREDSAEVTIELMLDSTISWNIGNVDENITVVPTSGESGVTTLTITIPANETGSARTSSIPIMWGGAITIIQVVQVSNWSVTTSSNVGTATANGQTGTIEVENGDSVTFETTGIDGYGFGYWIINNTRYYEKTVTLSIEDNTTAEAYWYNTNLIVKMACNDDNTSVTGVEKLGAYWFLNIGQTYTFVNNEANLSGYLFDDDANYTSPAVSVTRQVLATDTSLTVFYDTLLANLRVVNNSDITFNSASIIVTSPSGGVIPSPSGSVSPGNEVNLKYSYLTSNYGTYNFTINQPNGIYVDISPASINYQQGSAISTVIVTVSNLRWENDTLSVIADGGTLTNMLTIPSNLSYTIDSDLSGVTITPSSGTGSRNISIRVPANADAARTITITANIYNGSTFIRQLQFTISQASGLFEPEIAVDDPSRTVGADGEIYTLSLTCNTTWSLSTGSDWFTAVPVQGDGDQSITITVYANTTGTDRSGTITFTTTYGANDVDVKHDVYQD